MHYGLLIDYKWCTGCHSCEIACQQSHDGYAPTTIGGEYRSGIEVREMGPFDLGNHRFQYDFIPAPTDFCDLCGQRIAEGDKPACVGPCQGACIHFGTIDELAEMMTSPHMVLYR